MKTSYTVVLGLCVTYLNVSCDSSSNASFSGSTRQGKTTLTAPVAKNSISQDAQVQSSPTPPPNSNSASESSNNEGTTIDSAKNDSDTDNSSTTPVTSTPVTNPPQNPPPVVCNGQRDPVLGMSASFLSALRSSSGAPINPNASGGPHFKAISSANSIAVMNFAAARAACQAIGGDLPMPDYLIMFAQNNSAQLSAVPSGYAMSSWARSGNSQAEAIDLVTRQSLLTCTNHFVICQVP